MFYPDVDAGCGMQKDKDTRGPPNALNHGEFSG